MSNDKTPPFAITARNLGHPRKLYTPITVINFYGNDHVAAARVNAMWDTGAELCLMTKDLAAKLHVEFSKSIKAVGLTGSADTPMGYGYVSLVANGFPISVITGIVDEIHPDYSYIIGLNLISKGCLAISSTSIDTTLSFVIPTPEPIDFTRLKNITDEHKTTLPLSPARENIDVRYGLEALDMFMPPTD